MSDELPAREFSRLKTRISYLSARQQPNGGKPLQRVEPASGQVASCVTDNSGLTEDVADGSTIFLCIHGYNNDTLEAIRSYLHFVDNLEQMAPDILPVAKVFGFVWPGDEAWKLISGPSFLDKPKIAETVGANLASYLDSRCGKVGIDIYFVAHSLGNRVLFYALRQFMKINNPKLRLHGILCMAAAVPAYTLEEKHYFLKEQTDAELKEILNAFKLVQFRYNGYSHDDKTLRRLFSVASIILTLPKTHLLDEISNQKAIGYLGKPDTPGLWSLNYNSYLDHSFYWPDKPNALKFSMLVKGYVPQELPTATLPIDTIDDRLLQ